MFKNIKTADQLEQARHDCEAESVRCTRDSLLDQTDYMVMPDYPMVDKTAVEAYRQALRDITEQSGFPFSIQYPERNF